LFDAFYPERSSLQPFVTLEPFARSLTHSLSLSRLSRCLSRGAFCARSGARCFYSRLRVCAGDQGEVASASLRDAGLR
jgi:hypothetical protein